MKTVRLWATVQCYRLDQWEIDNALHVCRSQVDTQVRGLSSGLRLVGVQVTPLFPPDSIPSAIVVAWFDVDLPDPPPIAKEG